VVLAVLHTNGGFTEALAALSSIPAASNPDLQGAFTSFFGPEPIMLLGVVILTSLGTWGLPQMVGKFYAIKNESAISKGTLISTLFAIVVAGGCYFLGGFGRLYGDSIEYSASGTPVYDSIVPQMLSGLPDIVVALVVILVLSASMSTLSSLVLASSSTLTLDFIKGTLIKDLNEKKQLLIMRALIVVFIAISVVLAIVQYKSNVTFIAQLMGVSWGALAGAFLAPFLFGLYWKRTSTAAVWVSFVFSTVVMLANVVVKSAFPVILQSPINAGAFCMIAGLILVPIVSVFTKAPDKQLVDDIFSCYDRKVVVTAKDAIGDEHP